MIRLSKNPVNPFQDSQERALTQHNTSTKRISHPSGVTFTYGQNKYEALINLPVLAECENAKGSHRQGNNRHTTVGPTLRKKCVKTYQSHHYPVN